MADGQPKTLVAALAEHADRAPDEPAVSDDVRLVTYSTLDAETSRIAKDIVRRCGRTVEPVGVLLRPGVDAISALYGVMKAGKIALPLDVSSPRDALGEVLSHAGARITVTDDGGRRLLSDRAETLIAAQAIASSDGDAPLDHAVDVDQPATIFYTSGSTGRPRGFVVTHGAQMRAARSWCAFYDLRESDRLALLFHYSFGASRVCLYGALASGAELRVYDPRRAAIAQLARKLEDDGITFAHCSASLLRALVKQLRAESSYPALRTLAIGAESLHPRDIVGFRRHVSPECTLAYTYATSESGPVSALLVDATAELPDGPLPVGRVLPGKQVQIDGPDENGVGEILVGGEGLATGYWRDESHTAARFIHAPDDADRTLFRTGDRGRLRPDRMLEYHGRIGTMVKVRGYSLDPAEVEAALRTVAPVAEAAVVLRHGARDRLVAYVVPEDGCALEPVKLRALLADRLPPHKIPASFVAIDALPRTNRGKVDVAALPTVSSGRPDLMTPFVAPYDELHQAVAAAWEEVLEVSPIGIHDDFTDLGGDSLAAAEIVSMLRDALDREIPVAVFLDAAKVASMAELLRRGGEERMASPLVTFREGGSRPPFFCVHGGGGNVLLFQSLAERLSADQPFHGFQVVGVETQRALASVERLAAVYVQSVRQAQPSGPFALGGYSFGGAVAFEMARQLEAMGHPPSLVVILDTPAPAVVRGRFRRRRLHRRALARTKLAVTRAAWRTGWPRWRAGQSWFRRAGGPEWQWIDRLTQRAMMRYFPSRYGGRVLVLRTVVKVRPADLGWQPLVAGRLELGELEGSHLTILKPPVVDALARSLDLLLADLDAAGRGDAEIARNALVDTTDGGS